MLVAEGYVWPLMRQDVTVWARTCLQCKRVKVSRHTRSDIGKFEPSSSRFTHRFCGTPISIRGYLLLPHLCESVLQMARSISTGRDFRRGHSQGLLHWLDCNIQLKAAVMARGSAQCIAVLPTILLGFHATWKEDLQAATAEMIYGAPIR
ncbi:retrovirus-related Pol polyprotein from transposon 412 [Nephila pilipes]|uniref:Retrovirus-related Pol polyprotein from transposon 412 n=1 Tax=Nephila pilipes TaxID=299642 RepID=A0A8X6UTA5_NEPPI|nr:retrovirus-related Pol polyprotein from transposon 412 [Nephila pilipes]